MAALALVASPARAEVPGAHDRHGREFRVDFSARHLDVDADLGELSLSGDVVVTVGRYRLGGERVRLKRGPRGISVEGGGDIAFCSCESPPITLGYSSVTIAPPSDVLIQGAVLRAHDVPVFWLPYLWLRSPDRLGVIFPSVEWRGDDGLLVGSGLHVPFASNQGRSAERALDIGAYGYLQGGVRIDAALFTPQSTSFVRWDHLEQSALTIDAHAAASGVTSGVWAYDIDASRGERGRSALTSLEAAARPFDHARIGAAGTGRELFALSVTADAPRGDAFGEAVSLGPSALFATGGRLADRVSYSLDLGAGSALATGEARTAGSEARALERAALEAAQPWGPALLRAGAFQQAELASNESASAAQLRAGGGLALSLPLARRYGAGTLVHSMAPQLLARYERLQAQGSGSNLLVATAGASSALGRAGRGGAARLWLGGGWVGEPQDLEPALQAELASDTRWVGARISGVAEPEAQAAEGTARVRVGARGGTMLSAYAEARTEAQVHASTAQASGDLLPHFQALSAYAAEGLTTGADLMLSLWSILLLSGGADVDPLDRELLALRSALHYRHACGCFGLSAAASTHVGRGGFDAALSLDLMP